MPFLFNYVALDHLSALSLNFFIYEMGLITVFMPYGCVTITYVKPRHKVERE